MKSKRISPEEQFSTTNKIKRDSCFKKTSHSSKQNKSYASSQNIRSLNNQQNQQTLKTTLKQRNQKISSRKTYSKKQIDIRKNCLSEPKLNRKSSNMVFENSNQTGISQSITKKRSITSLHNKKDKENAQLFFQKSGNILSDEIRGILKKPNKSPKKKNFLVSPQAIYQANFDQTSNLVTKTQNIPIICPSSLVSKKLFGKNINEETILENRIGFNIDLNKILKKLDTIIENEKFKTKKTSSDLKKQSVLSQENLQLLRKLTKKINFAEKDMAISNVKRKAQTLDQIQDFVDEKTPSKEPFHKNQLQRSNDLILIDKSQIIQSKKKQFQDGQIETTVKKLKEKHEEHSQYLKTRIKQIQKDNIWLIENVQKLLQQNQQLKKIMRGQK